MENRLCLGTAQIGRAYGYFSKYIKREMVDPTLDDARKILDKAIELGINWFDTAPAYGNSEDFMGKVFNEKVNIVSKLLPEKLLQNPNIIDEIKKTCDVLGQPVEGYLFHTEDYVYNDEMVRDILNARDSGYVKNVGVSTYNPDRAIKATKLGFDFIQIPYSIFDQRFDQCEFFELTKDIKVFARSAFLQGLLLSDSDIIPDEFKIAIPYIKQLETILRGFGITKKQACLMFTKLNKNIDYLVFGASSAQQIEQNVGIWNSNINFIECRKTLVKFFSDVPESIIIPSKWK